MPTNDKDWPMPAEPTEKLELSWPMPDKRDVYPDFGKVDDYFRLIDVEVEVDSYTAEYAGCGSHLIKLRLKLSHDELSKLYHSLKEHVPNAEA